MAIQKPVFWLITAWREPAELDASQTIPRGQLPAVLATIIIDGRTKTTDYTHDELRLMHAEGVLRTLAIWKQEGLLKA